MLPIKPKIYLHCASRKKKRSSLLGAGVCKTSSLGLESCHQWGSLFGNWEEQLDAILDIESPLPAKKSLLLCITWLTNLVKPHHAILIIFGAAAVTNKFLLSTINLDQAASAFLWNKTLNSSWDRCTKWLRHLSALCTHILSRTLRLQLARKLLSIAAPECEGRIQTTLFFWSRCLSMKNGHMMYGFERTRLDKKSLGIFVNMWNWTKEHLAMPSNANVFCFKTRPQKLQFHQRNNAGRGTRRLKSCRAVSAFMPL